MRKGDIDSRYSPDEFRLGEEQDNFCETCVGMWRILSRPAAEREVQYSTCHVCGRYYDDIFELRASMPVTNIEDGQASICCRECYDIIKANHLANEKRERESAEC